MASLEVDLITYSDASFTLTQTEPFANGLSSVGTNPLHMQVRTTASDPTVWIELTTANGMIVVTSGTSIALNIAQSQLENLPQGQYVYSVIMSLSGGLARAEVWRGTLTHNAGPTRWDAGTP